MAESPVHLADGQAMNLNANLNELIYAGLEIPPILKILINKYRDTLYEARIRMLHAKVMC
jgi:phosphoenolpyruvate synthase/pyruvate phosphate dikinase